MYIYNMTNKQALTKMINSLDSIQQGILRDRILTMCNYIIENQEMVAADMKNHIISPELYIQTMKDIKVKLEF